MEAACLLRIYKSKFGFAGDFLKGGQYEDISNGRRGAGCTLCFNII